MCSTVYFARRDLSLLLETCTPEYVSNYMAIFHIDVRLGSGLSQIQLLTDGREDYFFSPLSMSLQSIFEPLSPH